MHRRQQKFGEVEKVSDGSEAYNVAKAKRTEIHTAAAERASKRSVAVRSTESEMQDLANERR